MNRNGGATKSKRQQAILALVLSINLASQGLRDAFDPRLHTS